MEPSAKLGGSPSPRSGPPRAPALRCAARARRAGRGRLLSRGRGAHPPPLAGARRRWTPRTRWGGVPACPSSLSQPTCLPLPSGDPLQGGKARAKINGHVQGARGRAGPLGVRYLGAPGVLSGRPCGPFPLCPRQSPYRSGVGGTHWPRSRYEQLTCQGFPKGGLDRELWVGKGTGDASVTSPNAGGPRVSFFSSVNGVSSDFEYDAAEFRTVASTPSLAPQRGGDGKCVVDS